MRYGPKGPVPVVMVQLAIHPGLDAGAAVVTLQQRLFDAHELFSVVERRRVTAVSIVGDGTGRRCHGPPKRFAQGIGADFSSAQPSSRSAEAGWAHPGPAGHALVAAALESVFGYCLGCKAFALLAACGRHPGARPARAAATSGRRGADCAGGCQAGLRHGPAVRPGSPRAGPSTAGPDRPPPSPWPPWPAGTARHRPGPDSPWRGTVRGPRAVR